MYDALLKAGWSERSAYDLVKIMYKEISKKRD
jgi:hypothetical protein